MVLSVYSDGACGGNPGPSAVAFLIMDDEGRILKEHSEGVEVGTVNQAEYKALICAMRSAKDLDNEAICYSDSMLVVKQMRGEWRVKHPNMRPLWREAVALKERLQKISIAYVPRSNRFIKRVDQLANEELARQFDKMAYHPVETKMKQSQVLPLSSKSDENILLQETNKGGYKLEIIAKFVDPYPVAYTIRVSTPEGNTVDYISTLEGFKSIGELLMALHHFAQTKLYPTNTESLKEVLTAEKIKSFAEVLKSVKFGV